jgi:hypothetical protein
MGKPIGEMPPVQRFNPRATILGFSLGLFVLTCVHHYHVLTMYSGSPPMHDSLENEIATLLLVLASICLLWRSWWSHLIAIVAARKVFYNPGFLSLWIYANVNMDGSWSVTTWKKWFQFTLLTQPQYLLDILVAGTIYSYAAIALTQQSLRSNRTRASKALQLTAR